jgi:hypothetical protein
MFEGSRLLPLPLWCLPLDRFFKCHFAFDIQELVVASVGLIRVSVGIDTFPCWLEFGLSRR